MVARKYRNVIIHNEISRVRPKLQLDNITARHLASNVLFMSLEYFTSVK